MNTKLDARGVMAKILSQLANIMGGTITDAHATTTAVTKSGATIAALNALDNMTTDQAALVLFLTIVALTFKLVLKVLLYSFNVLN